MAKNSNQNLDKYLVLLGKRIMSLIRNKGYSSVYQFWIHKAADSISRRNLQKIVKGKSNPKFLTLLEISRLLEISVSELLEIEGL